MSKDKYRNELQKMSEINNELNQLILKTENPELIEKFCQHFNQQLNVANALNECFEAITIDRVA